MPSHLAHLVFVQEALQKAGRSLPEAVQSYLALGAQGPDIFYHNQRRKPSALLYGSLIHRRSYGALCSSFYRHAAERSADRESWYFAYVLAFASHAVLDRFTHPFINYWSGWREPGDPATERLRGMHPFLERLIDREVVLRYRGCEPRGFGFYAQVNCGETPPGELTTLLAAGLRAVYSRAEHDGELERRMEAAYLDTMGFYEWTDSVDEEFVRRGLEREPGDLRPRWLSIVHPPVVPTDLDVMNSAGRTWCHPCNSREEHTESFWALFDRALNGMVRVARGLIESWETDGDPADIDQRAAAIEAIVGNANLSDGRPTERPCRRRHAGPLPLPELQDEIVRVISGKAG